MSGGLISRSGLVKKIHEYVECHRNDDEISWTGFDWLLKEEAVIDIINGQPAVQGACRAVGTAEAENRKIVGNTASGRSRNSMGREILFRAKHIHALPQNGHLDGKWAEGYLSGENFIFDLETRAEVLIDPETVCQYTGLADKNGRKIFEGDIIRYCRKLFQVVWVPGCAMFSAHPLEESRWIPGMNTGTVKNVEVVGNIFDNPKMLEASGTGAGGEPRGFGTLHGMRPAEGTGGVL